MNNNPYVILGIPDNCSIDEVKKAYKKLVLQLHPDKCESSIDKFMEVKNAYESILLSTIEPQSAFRQINDELIELQLTLEEMVFGCCKSVKVNVDQTCSVCNGSRIDKNAPKIPCTNCLGVGKSMGVYGFSHSQKTCPTCNGAGGYPVKKCSACFGSGIEFKTINMTLQVPECVEDGEELKFMANSKDLFVKIKQSSHEIFKKVKNDLYCDKSIKLIDAITGTTIHVRNIYGFDIEFNTKAGTQYGDIITISKAGVINKQTNETGDMHIIIKFDIPTGLNDDKINILKTILI